MATPAYCGGRFPVPPAFDFVLLPLKTKKVAVVSIIGSWDSLTCGSTSQLIENFLQKSVFSLPCGKSVIQGFYDCERQLIFLQFRDTEYLLDELLSNAKNSEDILTEWDMERLKYLYYLFLVSHFILIVSYGTNLDPRYVALFKLLNRIRQVYPFRSTTLGQSCATQLKHCFVPCRSRVTASPRDALPRRDYFSSSNCRRRSQLESWQRFLFFSFISPPLPP
uniref:Nonsense-mediated mRNA decay factor SMG8 n=2 Tax=Schistocephalus solidus TaxID=70667 RepID=A0A0X3P3H3_SCHSO